MISSPSSGGGADPLPVTVLLPTFNRAHYIREALESILHQTVPPAQVIVIDDGSTDATPQVVSEWGERVEYVRQENSGKSAALNNGLGRARCPYVWIFDDDDIAAPDALAALHAALRNNPSAGFSYGRCDRFYGEWPADERVPNYAFQSDSKQALYIRLMEDFFLWQGAMLVKRECYDEAGPFDTRLSRSQDYEMALRLARRFESVAVPKIAFHQRHHSGTRGPRDAQVAAAQIEDAWRKFNHVIFRELHESHDLSEFVVPPDLPLPKAHLTRIGLIQRGSIMARKGIWDLASSDFRKAASVADDNGHDALTLQEIAALRVVFQPGARSVFEKGGDAAAFGKAIAAFGRPLRQAITANLLFPVTYRIRRVGQHADKRSEALQLWRIVSNLFRPGCVPRIVEARRQPLDMLKVSLLEVEPPN